MKKIVSSALAVFALCGFAFSQEVSVEFENKISSDIVNISEDDSKFEGIKEQVTAEIETERVNAGVSLITELVKDDDDNLGFTEYEFDKAYVEFKPVEKLSLDFNKKVFLPGSYLPIEDDNVGNGNIASGFSLVFRPIENLSIASGIRIPSVFADEDNQVDMDAGIEFTNDAFSIGATLRSPVNDAGFGIFGSFTGIENLVFNLGFAYNDDFCDVAGNLLTLGATYELSIFTIGLDFVTNFGDDGKDLYTALCVETGITDSFILETQGTLNMDFDDSESTEVIADIGAAYVNGNHKIRAGVAVSFTEDTTGVYFPVYYKYCF